MPLKLEEVREDIEISPFDDLWFAREYERA